MAGNVAATVDATGLRCPLPMLKAKRALAMLTFGERLLVRATDPESVKDFQAFTELKGHRLVAFDSADGVFEFIIEK